MIKIKKSKILLCILMFTSFINAQITVTTQVTDTLNKSIKNVQIKVTGKVTDTLNKPIEFANVVLSNKEKTKIIAGTITDENGYFKIETDLKTELNLQISYIGFTDFSKNINTSTNLESIVLKSNNELGEVVIIARKKRIEQKEDKIILNIKNGNLNKGYNGVEILKYAPNIWVDNSDNILIHHKPAMIMINGQKVNLQGSDLSNYLKSINSNDIERIEIQTNASANIDAENSGGIIDIILNNKSKGVRVIIKSYYTQKENGYNTVQPSLNLSYGTEKWNIYSNYGYKQNTDNLIFISENLDKTNKILYQSNGSSSEDSNKHNYQLGFVYDITKNQTIGIETFGSIFKKYSDGIASIDVTQNENILDTGSIKNDETNNNNIYNGLLNYTVKFDSIKSKLNLFIDYTRQDLTNNNGNISNYNIGFYENDDEHNNAIANSEIVSSQIDFQKEMKLLNFEIGSKYTLTNRNDNIISETLENNTYTENDRTSSFDYNEKIIAGYFSLNKKIKKYFIKTGLRYEKTKFKGVDILVNNDVVKQNYDNFFPFIYLSKSLKNNKSISVSYSKNINRPSFSLLNNSIRKINDFTYSIGNPDLRAEYTNNYSVSLNTKNQVFDIYYSRTTDKINTQWFIVDDINYHQSQNFGASQQIGVNYSLNTKINKWWYLSSQVSSLFREFETNNTSTSKPSFMFSNSNIFEINKTTSIDFSLQYISPFIDANFTGVDSFEANFILKKSLIKDKFDLRFYINDIFNTIRDKNDGVFDDLNTSFYQKRKTRSFTIWLSYNFENKNKINNQRNESKNNAKDRL